MIRRPPRSTQSRSSAASDVYKRQHLSIFRPPRADAAQRERVYRSVPAAHAQFERAHAGRLNARQQFFNLATLSGTACRKGAGRDERTGPGGDEHNGDGRAGGGHWPSVDVGRRGAMTRDAGLQLQSHAWTPNNNGEFHSRTRRRGWPSKVAARRRVALQTVSFSHYTTSAGPRRVHCAMLVRA